MAKIFCPLHKELSKKSPKPIYVAGLRHGACGEASPARAADVRMPDTGERIDGAYYIVRNICGLPLFSDSDETGSESWDLAAMKRYQQYVLGIGKQTVKA